MLQEDMTTKVGRGELAVLNILKFLFPTRIFFTQVKLVGLVAGRKPKDWPELSSRQLKETIDIVMAVEKNDKLTKIVAVRIQDPHHKGRGYSHNDVLQGDLLESSGIDVCDFNWYECNHIWKDEINVVTVEEVITNLRLHKII